MQTSKSMLVYLGANAHKKLVHQLLELDTNIRFVSSHIFPETPLDLLDDKVYCESVITFDDAIKIESGKIQFSPINDYNLVSIIDEIMSDKHLSLLWSRFNNEIRRQNDNEVKRYEVIYTLIKSALHTCITLKPSSVVFSYEPHMLPTYIFKRIALALGIEVYTLTISPFVWKLFCEREKDNETNFLNYNLFKNNDGIINGSVKKMLSEKQGHYSAAKPFYEKRNVKNRLGTGIFHRLKVNGWNPNRVLPCQLAIREYQAVVTGRNIIQNLKYISLYLHYQPEQTTLPDGRLFVHQLFAIQMLYSAIAPLGISLVIREHPATFESIFDPKWRPEGFYNDIKNIGPEIYFDDISEDPFTLIEKSIAVSSINGTVLLEGLLRGKPAISFGKHTLKGLVTDALVDSFSDESVLREKIKIAAEIPTQSIIDFVEEYLYAVYPATYGAEDYLGNEFMTTEILQKSRFDALLQVVEQIK